MRALLPWENPDRTRIGRLRVRGAAESTGLRLGLAAVLDRADLRPPGLPPAAVLIVRRMGDPLPGRLAPRAPLAIADAAWQRAARERLAGLYRGAARPGREAVPADAEAVAFADEGEFLASLALDIVRGDAGERWWWRNLDGLSAASAPTLASLFCDRAIWVPAVLSRLAQQQRAAEIVGTLTPPEALAVLTAVSRAHGAAALAAAAMPPQTDLARDETSGPPGATAALSGGETGQAGRAAAEPPAAPSRYALPPGPPDRSAVPPRRFVAGGGGAISAATDAAGPREEWRTVQPPWSAWLPEGAVPEELAPPQRALLGVALALHRRPEAVRSAGFAAALQRWRQVQERLPARSDTAAIPAVGAAPPPRRLAPVAQRAAPVQSPPSGPALPRAGDLSRAAPEVAGAPSASSPAPANIAPAGPVATAPDRAAPPHRAGWKAAPRALEAAPPVAASAAGEAAAGEALAADRVPPAADPVLDDGVETALGGVLFLVNLMSALDLPGCFEDDWRLASILGAWGVLAVLGRALLAQDHGGCGDPIWPALAALSGSTPGAPSGAGLPRRPGYRLPAAWAAQIPAGEESGPHIWAARGRTLRLWSSAGFLLSETRRDASPALAQARNEAQRHGSLAAPRRARFGDAPFAAFSGALAKGVGHALAHWLCCVVPFVRLRLVCALGIDPAKETLEDALLARAGRIYVTTTHVDLVMALKTASVPVRLAGLDRSPGWLAEFGRVILFHFE